MTNSKISLMLHLSELEDPRSGNNFKYNFVEIMFISVCAIVSGCQTWTDFEDYGNSKLDWLRTFLELKNGIPSHDTFRRIFCILNFSEFQKVFMSWAAEIKKKLKIKNDQICIDGKTLKGSISSTNAIKAIHMVNAWSTGASICLGQVPTEEKSNEITAIPELLKILEIEGCLVSIDAIGCQTEISDLVIKKGGDYLLALKENQKCLFEATEELFRRSSTNWLGKLEKSEFTETESGMHGRDVTRTCRALHINKDIGFFPHEKWPSIRTLVRIQSESIKRSTGEISTETRYYVSSAEKGAKYFNDSVRSHWEVENNLHWSLDVAFDEDNYKKWAAQSAKNFSLLRKMALNLLNKFQDPKKRSLKRKQNMSLMDNSYLLKVLFAGAT